MVDYSSVDRVDSGELLRNWTELVKDMKERPGLYEGVDGLLAVSSFIEQLILRTALG